MPLPKRRTPPRRKDRRERSRSRSFSPYARRGETHHHADDYHSYSRPSQSRSTSGYQGYHRSRTPVGHMTSTSSTSNTQPPARRHRYSPSARHEVRSSREHPRRSFSPQPRHSSLSSKQRSRHPREGFEDSRSFLGQSENRERWMSETRMRPIGSPSHRYGGSESTYPPDRGEPRDWERLERVQHNPDDLRHSIGPRFSGSTRKKSGYPEGSYYDREYEPKGRESKYSKNSPEILPDFSKRPDKYQYEEWREHPEMVPRGSNYYEHDTRPEADGMTNRSRGASRFRSRGGGILRRPFRPFRSRGTFKSRITTHGSTSRRPFATRSLGRFRTRSRSNVGFRSRSRGRGGSSSDYSAADDWKESSYSKSSEKQSASEK